jgi:energy-converting hydrogenase B subunit D
MDAVLAVSLLLVAGTGTAVVLTRDPARQAITLSALGLALTVFFLVYQAPDVALSQLAVGTVVVPLMIALTVAKTNRRKP